MVRFFVFIVVLVGIIIGVITFSPLINNFFNEEEVTKTEKIIVNKNNNKIENQHEVESLENQNLSFDEFLQKGKEFSDRGFLTLAVNNFNAAVRLNPKNKDAQISLIKAQIALRDFESAQNSTENALKIFIDDKNFVLLLGEILLQRSEFEKSRNIFSSLSDTVPEKYFYLGALEAFNGNFDESKRLLNIAKESQTMSSRSDILLGAFYEFSLFPNGDLLHLKLLLAKGFNQLGLYEMAIVSTKKILETNAKYRDAWLILGHSYLSLERYDFAKNAFKNALKIDSTKPETTYFLAIAEAELENYNEAISYMERAIANGFIPKADAIKKLGDFYLQSEKYTLAAQKYEEILHISDNDVNNFIQPIWILIDFVNDPKKALEIAKWSIEKHPNSALSNNLLGWAYLANEDYVNAEKSLNKALEIDKNVSAIYLNFGKLHKAKGEKAKAKEYFLKAYELDPSSSVGALAAQEFNSILTEE